MGNGSSGLQEIVLYEGEVFLDLCFNSFCMNMNCINNNGIRKKI